MNRKDKQILAEAYKTILEQEYQSDREVERFATPDSREMPEYQYTDDQSILNTEDSIESFKKEISDSWDIPSQDQLDEFLIKFAKKYAVNGEIHNNEPFNDDWRIPEWDDEDNRINTSLEGYPFTLKLSDNNTHDEFFADIDVDGRITGSSANFSGHPDDWYPDERETELDLQTQNIYMTIDDGKYIIIDDKKVPQIWRALANIAENQLENRIN